MFTTSDIASLTSPKRKSNAYCVIKDNFFDDIIEQLHADVQCLKDRIRPAKMSKARGQEEWTDENHRGDSLCWVTPPLCSELNLSALQIFMQRMLVECGALKTELGLSAEYTCQFAVYPGKGEGYNRHKDAFSVPPTSSATATAAAAAAGGGGEGTSEEAPRPLSRQLTCLLYLNKDWIPQDGGQLRVFTHPGVHLEKGDDAFNFWGVNGYDINPLYGRMIVFRSELVEHAVLPCFKERMALTFWINGVCPAATGCESDVTVFKFEADAPKPEIISKRDGVDGCESDSHSESSESSTDSEEEDANDSGRIEVHVLHEVHEEVEVKMNGLWVDGTVTSVDSARYTVTTSTGDMATNKGRYEIRPPGPKHFGTIQSKMCLECCWLDFRRRWRDMSAEERGAEVSVVFGANTWSCCGGAWNSPPCGRRK